MACLRGQRTLPLLSNSSREVSPQRTQMVAADSWPRLNYLAAGPAPWLQLGTHSAQEGLLFLKRKKGWHVADGGLG